MAMLTQRTLWHLHQVTSKSQRQSDISHLAFWKRSRSLWASVEPTGSGPWWLPPCWPRLRILSCTWDHCSLSLFSFVVCFRIFSPPGPAARCTTLPPSGQSGCRASARPSPPRSPSSSSTTRSRSQTGGCASSSATPSVEVFGTLLLVDCLHLHHRRLCRHLRASEGY